MPDVLRHHLMWIDALLCFAVPQLARYQMMLVNHRTGVMLPVDSARFRWVTSAREWSQWARTRLPAEAHTTYGYGMKLIPHRGPATGGAVPPYDDPGDNIRAVIE